MKKRTTLCFLVFTCCIFYASIPAITLGEEVSLAQQVLDKHRATFEREDIQTVLPNLFVELKDPEVQALLTPETIDLGITNPDILTTLIPDIDPKFIALLKEDAELKEVLSDPLLQALLQDPAAIDELAVLLGISEPSGPTEPPIDVENGDVQQPDLVIESVEIVPSTFLAPEQEFRLYATLKNQGTGESTATTLRYYHSVNDTISTQDTQIGRGNRNPLAVDATVRKYLAVVAPTEPGGR